MHWFIHILYTYGNLVWGNTLYVPNKATENTEYTEKIIRLISFKSYLEYTEPLFQNSKILNIFKTGLNVYKIYLNFLMAILHTEQ
jgi:hypothetical protein